MNWIESIKNYIPLNNQEKVDKDLILHYIEKFNDLLFRENPIAHITSSAFVVNKSRNKTLMIHHNIYNSWSFTGGHADGDADLMKVALKELKEETNIKDAKFISDDIISLDILPVMGHTKKGKYISPHIHISITYLLEADESDLISIKEDENSNVGWLNIKDLDKYTSKEPHMQIVFKKIITKLSSL